MNRRRCRRALFLAALLAGAAPGALPAAPSGAMSPAAPPRPGAVLTLPAALAFARAHSPALRQARAQTRAARARADQSRARLFPQVSATATYDRTTANFVARPGFVPTNSMIMPTSPTFDTFNYWNAGVTLSYVLIDFGVSRGAWHAAKLTATATGHDQRATRLQVALDVRSTYLQAVAQRALVGVARDALGNQQSHMAQIRAFVEAEIRPQIDLVTQQSAVASARVDLINAENNYANARARLDQVMGLERAPSAPAYDVSDTLPPVPGEDGSLAGLYRQALAHRPELRAADARVRAAQASRRSALGGYGPTLTAQASLTDAGSSVQHLTWNVSGGLALSWPLFQGGLVPARVRESSANIAAALARRDAVVQTVRLDLETARLSLKAAKAARAAAAEGRRAAAEQLHQADARYRNGVGTIIELDDAQLALTRASAQLVQTDYQLGLARAQLMHALGEE